MAKLETILMVLAAAEVAVLGFVHLILTFYGPKFKPRDRSLAERMQQISPVISAETTMWKAWVGFNASHSYGAILFGLIYAYLSIQHAGVLFNSTYLLAVGLSFLVGFLILAKKYWFKTPFIGIGIALVLYIASIVVSKV